MLLSMTKAVEVVLFKGVKYRRYAGIPYFTPGQADKRRGARYLHQDVWATEHGPIPEGHDVHHQDGNPLNNDVSNLQLMESGAHQALHAAERVASGWYTTPEKLAHLERIRPMAAAWHSTEAGNALHAELGRKTWENVETRTAKCGNCKGDFEYRALAVAVYCSNNCKSAARRASGIDDVVKDCARCGKKFSVNRYSPKKTCSRICGQRLRRAS